MATAKPTKTAADSVSSDVDDLKQDVEALRQDIGQLVNSLSNAGKAKVDDGISTAKGYADQAKAQMQDTREQAEGQIRENPLVAVGAAFGVGYVLGKLLSK